VTYLRHSTRHIHHTVVEYIREQLRELKWMTEGQTPFGATPVEIITAHPKEWETTARLEAGTVAITLGDESMPDLEESGGPLYSMDVPIFIDVFSDNESITLALALDIRDILLGRLTGSTRLEPGRRPSRMSRMSRARANVIDSLSENTSMKIGTSML